MHDDDRNVLQHDDVSIDNARESAVSSRDLNVY